MGGRLLEGEARGLEEPKGVACEELGAVATVSTHECVFPLAVEATETSWDILSSWSLGWKPEAYI